MRPSPKQQPSPLRPSPALQNSSLHRNNVSACSSMVSWADPNEVCQMLDYFTATPTRTHAHTSNQASTPKRNSFEVDDSLRSRSFEYDRKLDQKRPVLPHNSASLISPKTREVRVATPSPKKSMPLKAQRLMGLDSPIYHKSTFDDWEDEENRRTRLGSPLSRRPKVESKIFFKTPTRSTSFLADTVTTTTTTTNSTSTSSFPSPSIGDETSLSVPNKDSPGSKWSTLGQRLRSNSTTPIAMRLKRKDSSPTSSNFLIDRHHHGKENIAVTREAPPPISRTASMIETPTATSFSSPALVQRKLSTEEERSRSEATQTSKSRLERSEWAEARASSRALNHLIDPNRRESKVSPPLRQWETQFNNDSNSSIDLAISSVYSSDAETQFHSIQSTPPLRFNPSRRPRAPFPPADQLDTDKAIVIGGIKGHQVKEEKQPLSPPLPPCPDKMHMPSRIMRPSPTPIAKEAPRPNRPRRPTESNIFAKSYQEPSTTTTTTTVIVPNLSIANVKTSRKTSAPPPQRPPPSIPIPPIPSTMSTLQVGQSKDQEEVSTSMESKRKTKGLMTALGMQTPSPLPTPMQASPDDTPSRFVFRGDDTDVPFLASLVGVERGRASADPQVELIVGGVTFETKALLLLGSKTSRQNDGLAKWLQGVIEEGEKVLEESISCNTLSVPSSLALTAKQANRSSSTKSSYSYDSGSFISPVLESSSSEEEESEEEYQPAFAYQMSPLAHPQWTVEDQDDEAMEKLLSPIQTLQFASPIRRRAHARTPTSVSSDNESNEGEESIDDRSFRNQVNSTPELVASSHAFIFTASSPPSTTTTTTTTTQSPTKPRTDEACNKTTSLKVKLDRDPQVYPIILHLLKHDKLPDYFSLNSIPVNERFRSLRSLSRECQWLGYDNLVTLCDHFDVL